MLRTRRQILLLATIWLLPSVAFSATYTWDSDGNPANGLTNGPGTWDTTTPNWFNAGADTAWTNNTTDIAAFGASGNIGGVVNVGASLLAGGIVFNGADSGGYMLTGTGNSTLTLSSGGIAVNSGAGAETLDSNLALALAGGQTWTNNGTGSLSINSVISNLTAASVSIGGARSTILNGVISEGNGQLNLVINGTGSSVVTLSAANGYSGGTTVLSGGTLQVSNLSGSATGSGSVSVSGTLQGATSPGMGQISGPVTINPGGKLLAALGTAINGATLTLSGGLTLAAGSSSTFAPNGLLPIGAIPGRTGSPLVSTSSGSDNSLNVSGTHTISVPSGVNIPNGMPYALYELYSYTGAAPSITSAISPFTGVFAAGTAPSGLNLGLFEGTSAAGTITNNQVDVAVGTKPFVYLKTGDAPGGTSFNAAGNWSNNAAPSSANNYVISVGSLLSPGGATAATFAGNSLTLGAGGILGIKTTGNGTTTTIPTLVLNGGTVANVGGSDGANYSDALGGTSILLMHTSSFDTQGDGRDLTVAAPISGPGGIIINPTPGSISTVTFTKPNSYTGTTTLDAGTLKVIGSGTLGQTGLLNLSSGVLDLNGTSQAIGAFSGGAAATVLNNGSGTSQLGIGNGGNFAGLIADNNNASTGKVALQINGTMALSGVNTYTGATTVGGTLILASTSGLANTAINVFGGATLSARPGAGTLTFGNIATASAGATLTLGSSNNITTPGAKFDMLDGAISTVYLRQGSKVSAGLTVGGNSSLPGNAGNASTLAFEIGDNGTTTGTDQLVVTNGVSVGDGANISITAITSNPLHFGTYPLITAGSFTNPAGFVLATPAVSIGSNQYALTLSNTGTAENLIVSPGGPPVAYWNGAHDGNWSAVSGGATNWLNSPSGTDTGAPPFGGTNVVFTANTAANLSTTLGADFAINSLTFTGVGTNAMGPVTISGNSLTINASAANGNVGGNGITVQAGAAPQTIASNIILGGSQTWTNNSSNPLTVTGGISDAGHVLSLVAAGTGPIVLSGNNTYRGTTIVSAGSTLILSGANTTTGPITVNGTIYVNSAGALASSEVDLNEGAAIDCSVPGGITNSGKNLFVCDGAWTYNGSQPLNLGAASLYGFGGGFNRTVSLGGTNSSLIFGGPLVGASFTETLTVNGVGNTLAVGGCVMSNFNNTNLTINGSANVMITGPITDGGVFGGHGALVYSGTGSLTLTGTSTFLGSMTINSGTVTLGSLTAGGSFGSWVNINFNGTGTFNYQGSSGGSSQYLGSLNFNAGDGTVGVVYGASATTNLTFMPGPAPSVVRAPGATANYVVNGGTNGTTNSIVVSGLAANAFIDQGSFFGGTNFAWNDGGGFVRGINYGSDPNSVTSGATTSIPGTPTNLYVQTTGPVSAEQTNTFTTLNISGNNTFTLDTGAVLTVSGILKSGNAVGGATISGGAGIEAASGAELVVRTDGPSDSLTISTPILDNAGSSLTKSGAGVLTLSGASTYIGTTTIANGTLRIANTTGSATGSGTVVVNTGATLTGTGAIGGSVSVNNGGVFSGNSAVAGAITVNSGGALKGSQSISGLTTINAGGILVASSGAMLTLNGGLTMASGSSATFALSGAPNGPTANPLVAVSSGAGQSFFVNSSASVNVDPASTINVSPTMPYALYQAFNCTGAPPAPGLLTAGTVPSGFNVVLLEGANAAGVNNQIDLAVGPRPFVYLIGFDTGATSSFNAGGWWSNRAAPNAADDYCIQGPGYSIQTPVNGGSATFGGNSLTVASGGSLDIKANGPSVTTVNNLVLDGGTVANAQGVNGANGLDVLAGNSIYLACTSFFDTSTNIGTSLGRVLQVTAPISGPGGLVAKAGSSSGLIVLSAANTYTGPTIVASGTLQLGGGGSLSPATTLNVTGVFTLGDSTGAASQTIAGLTGGVSGSAIVGGNSAVSTLTIANTNPGTFSGILGGTAANKNNLALVIAGSSIETLAGASSYTGGTTVQSGILQVTGSIAMNGSNKVFVAAGTDFSAASISRRVVTGNLYTGLGSTATGSAAGLVGSSADILAGKNTGTITSGSPASVSMAWRVRASNELPGQANSPLISDIISLTGMTSATVDPSPTDPFAMQMTYDPNLLGSEVVQASNGSIYLGWLNPNGGGPGASLWQNAIAGNFGNNATSAEQNFQGSFAAFQAVVGDTNIADYIGAWGVDTVNHDAWAVLNHNSQFGVVPEPATLPLMLIGVVFALAARLTICLRRIIG